MNLIQPAEVKRDENGWWSHPDLPDFEGDSQKWKDWLAAQNLELVYDTLDGESEDHPVWKSYFEEGDINISGWNPEPPKGSWFPLWVEDTEDGPMWVWARRKE
jgi:hypothetical protein